MYIMLNYVTFRLPTPVAQPPYLRFRENQKLGFHFNPVSAHRPSLTSSIPTRWSILFARLVVPGR